MTLYNKKNRPWIAFIGVLVFMAMLAAPFQARAQDYLQVTLEIQGIYDVIYDDSVQVPLPDEGGPTALDALTHALDGAGISYTLEEFSWGTLITEIGGDEGGTFGGWDGWMFTVNGEFPDSGAGDFEISEGDIILFYYNRWAAISSESPVLPGDEDPDVHITLAGDEFTLDAGDPGSWVIKTGDTGLVLDSLEKQDTQKVALFFTGTAAKGTVSIQAKSGALVGGGYSNELEIVVGVDFRQLADAVSTAQDLVAEAEVGEGMGQYPEEAVAALQEALDQAEALLEREEVTQEEVDAASDELSDAITRFQSAKIAGEASELEKSIAAALDYYSKNQTLSSWWELVALRGAGVDLQKGGWKLPSWNSESLPEDSPATTYAGFILGLMARGEYPEKAWGSRNILKELAEKQQEDGSFGDGVNSTIWGIIALKSAQFPFAEEKAVKYLMEQQLTDGGYTFFGDTGDPDLTGMALVALSPYKTQAGVKTAIARALGFLESVQLESGGFASWGSENANTNAAVLTGLVAVGENILSNRWVKNPSLYDALVSFQVENGSFSFLAEPLESNDMATSQALLALGDLEQGEPAFFRLSGMRAHPRTGGMGYLAGTLGLLVLGAAFLAKGKRE